MNNSASKVAPIRKSLIVGWALCLTTTLVLGVSAAAPHAKQHRQKVVTAAQKFKNIKVFKSLPASQLLPMMRKMSGSLGVSCDFCHVAGNFASDAKPAKNKARQMILMTAGIDKQYRTVENKVTCFMCHRGKTEPVGQPGGEM